MVAKQDASVIDVAANEPIYIVLTFVLNVKIATTDPKTQMMKKMTNSNYEDENLSDDE